MEFSTETRGFLKGCLNQAGVSTALVVDDAFDPPTRSKLRDEIFDFWNLIERDDELHDQLKSFGISAESEDDMTQEAIEILWGRRGEGGRLIENANRTLFANAILSLETVERIVASLEELELEVTPVGTDYDDPYPMVGLVFMDYLLGEPSDPESPVRSAQKARKIYRAGDENSDKPFIVLMSSFTELSSRAEKFREDSDLLGGLFDFASKDELTDPMQFALRVATWTSNMPLRHKIQKFVQTIDDTLCDSTREFMRKAKSLTIEDYAFVQVMSLQDDGHPLGDYIQWLFSSLLVNKVFEENNRFTDSKEEINKMSANSLPPSQLFPSTQLAEIYSIAIAEQGLEEIERHPNVAVEITEETNDADPDSSDKDTSPDETNTPQDNLPMLRLGDLLVHKDGRRVYMIATPDCDLQFAPDAGRVPEEGEAVMLVPGELRPLREPIGQGQIQTELYFHEGEQYRIAWERKKIITIPVANFLDWCTDKGYSRPARIRLPYAVKIQQEVIAGFSRVGMPVAPPLQDFVPFEIYCEGTDGTWEPLSSASNPSVNVIYTDHGAPTFVLTAAALKVLLAAMKELIDRYTLYIKDESDGRRKQQLRNKLRDLTKCVEEPEKLASMLEGRNDLPGSGGSRQLLDNTIVLHRNGDFSNYRNRRHVICLNIVL